MSGVLRFFCADCGEWFAEPICRKTFHGNRFEPAEYEWRCPSCEHPIDEQEHCKCEEDGCNRPVEDGYDHCAGHIATAGYVD